MTQSETLLREALEQVRYKVASSAAVCPATCREILNMCDAALQSIPEPLLDEGLVEQLNERAGLIVELLAIIDTGKLPARRTLINRAKRIIDGNTDGEANYRAYCMADPDHQPEGTPEALEQCARMLEEYGPDCFPANESGQVHFARAMMDATAAEIRAALSIPRLEAGRVTEADETAISNARSIAEREIRKGDEALGRIIIDLCERLSPTYAPDGEDLNLSEIGE